MYNTYTFFNNNVIFLTLTKKKLKVNSFVVSRIKNIWDDYTYFEITGFKKDNHNNNVSYKDWSQEREEYMLKSLKKKIKDKKEEELGIYHKEMNKEKKNNVYKRRNKNDFKEDKKVKKRGNQYSEDDGTEEIMLWKDLLEERIEGYKMSNYVVNLLKKHESTVFFISNFEMTASRWSFLRTYEFYYKKYMWTRNCNFGFKRYFFIVNSNLNYLVSTCYFLKNTNKLNLYIWKNFQIYKFNLLVLKNNFFLKKNWDINLLKNNFVFSTHIIFRLEKGQNEFKARNRWGSGNFEEFDRRRFDKKNIQNFFYNNYGFKQKKMLKSRKKMKEVFLFLRKYLIIYNLYVEIKKLYITNLGCWFLYIYFFTFNLEKVKMLQKNFNVNTKKQNKK